ncbi:MAG: hypothetical protein JWM89_1608 [Acidimicrobiales bacterium]|nr:hypothetical protein [Acidimicrobiales bacterium]
MTWSVPSAPAITRRRLLAGVAGTAAGLALSSCSLGRSSIPDHGDASDDGWGGQILDPPYGKPDVTFTDGHGQPFPLRERTAGRLALLLFGFTHCPDVCPTELNAIARAREAVGSGAGSRPLVLFVGVDTRRDTPEVLRTYLDRIDPTFVGLTATPQVIARALSDLDQGEVSFGPKDATGGYDVIHPAGMFAFTDDELAHRLYDPMVRQAALTRDLRVLGQGRWT